MRVNLHQIHLPVTIFVFDIEKNLVLHSCLFLQIALFVYATNV